MLRKFRKTKTKPNKEKNNGKSKTIELEMK